MAAHDNLSFKTINTMGKAAEANIFQLEDKVTDLSKTEVVGGKQYYADPEIRKIADNMISDHNIDIGPAQLEYLLVYPNISKKRAAKAQTAKGLLQFYSGVDFFIMISGEMWDMLDDETRCMLMYHQLLQCDARYKEKDREWTYSIRKPDYAAFYEMEKMGITWYKTIQATVSSLYDLEPAQENKVTI